MTRRETFRRLGRLPDDPEAALREVGFDLGGDAVRWVKGFHAARAFCDQYGHLEVPEGMVVTGVHVRAFLDEQRERAADGVLSSLRWARLGIGRHVLDQQAPHATGVPRRHRRLPPAPRAHHDPSRRRIP